MTESEAKTKWCPLTRVGVDRYPNVELPHAVAANRLDGDADGPRANSPTRCIASACMFWRWREHSGFAADFKGVPRTQYEADMLNRGNTPSTNRQGYCGAAGVVTHP